MMTDNKYKCYGCDTEFKTDFARYLHCRSVDRCWFKMPMSWCERWMIEEEAPPQGPCAVCGFDYDGTNHDGPDPPFKWFKNPRGKCWVVCGSYNPETQLCQGDYGDKGKKRKMIPRGSVARAVGASSSSSTPASRVLDAMNAMIRSTSFDPDRYNLTPEEVKSVQEDAQK